jgi:hypothetical protein
LPEPSRPSIRTLYMGLPHHILSTSLTSVNILFKLLNYNANFQHLHPTREPQRPRNPSQQTALPANPPNENPRDPRAVHPPRPAPRQPPNLPNLPPHRPLILDLKKPRPETPSRLLAHRLLLTPRQMDLLSAAPRPLTSLRNGLLVFVCDV